MLAAAGAGAVALGRALYRRSKEYDFKGKCVLVTGGSRGLGLVLAREFADEGARVAICARDPRELERAQRDLAARGAEVFAFPCDVTDRAQVAELIEVVTRRFGRIDVLVNNAGVIQVGPLEVMTLEDFEQAMNVHFWGPLYTTLAVLPQMRARRDGRIVNVSSIGGKVAVPHLVPYSASKFALAGLSDGLRAELAKDNVMVTTVQARAGRVDNHDAGRARREVPRALPRSDGRHARAREPSAARPRRHRPPTREGQGERVVALALAPDDPE
jgi:NAD(P)-dependent dehydrogenase (short-subunit alcohol dehydrogenase family)